MNLRKSIQLGAVGLMLSSLVTPVGAQTYQPGTYEGKSAGFGGDVHVQLTVDAEQITDIVITHAETPDIGGKAIEDLESDIVAEQNTDLAVITGATVTSEALQDALNDALSQAKGEVAEETVSEAGTVTFEPGTYTGSYEGMMGPVEVIVTVSEDKIEAVEIGEENESSGIGEQVFNTIPAQIVEYQSLDVDTVSGATITSVAVKLATEDALQQAGADIDSLHEVPTDAYKEDGEYDYDVVVAGGGLAGLTAALKAAEEGANVALIEKTGMLGGTSITASGNILGANAKEYVEPMYEAWQARSKSQEQDPIDEEKLRTIVEASPEVMALYDSVGVEFNLEVDEEKNFQTFRAAPNDKSVKNAEAITIPSKDANKKGGAQWIETLMAAVEEAGVDVYLNTPATEIIQDEDGTVLGLISDSEKYGHKVFNADATILATGDYARNEELTAELSDTAAGEMSATAIGNTGDGFLMAVEAGAAVHDYQESMSGVFNANPFDMPMIGDPTNGYPFEAVLLNLEGKRVYAEDGGSHPQKFQFVNANGPNSAWAIMDAPIAENFVNLQEYVQKTEEGDPYIRVYEADSIEELAELMELPADVVQAEIDRYNELAEQGEDTDFDKKPEFLQAIDEGPYYAAYLYDNTRGNYGGIVTNNDTAVVDEEGNPIPGLFASGIISSGDIFGDYYPGRQALGIASHMGYISGKTAANYAANN